VVDQSVLGRYHPANIKWKFCENLLMGILDGINSAGAASRLTEEAFYAEALREIESGMRRDGIWAMATPTAT
jgi:hypothetical protein